MPGAVSSHQTTARRAGAPLLPACGAGAGRGRSRSVPPRPGRWLLARARAAPSQATSARSLGVPMGPCGPLASSLARQSRWGLEPGTEGARSPATKGGWMPAPLASPPRPQAQSPALGSSKWALRGRALGILQHLIHCQREQSLGCRHAGEGVTAWLAGQSACSVQAVCGQGVGCRKDAGEVQMWCRQR